MTNTLVSGADLGDFPGAPFPEAVVDAIAATVRAHLGWHVAPEVTETVRVEHRGAGTVVLPSRRVAAVTEIRDVTDPANPVVLSEWRVTPDGILTLSWRPAVLEVDLTHGHPATPPELLPALADLGQLAGMNKAVEQQQAQPFSVVYRDAASVVGAWAQTHASVIAKHSARYG